MSTKTLTNIKFTSVIVIEEPPLNKVNWPFQKKTYHSLKRVFYEKAPPTLVKCETVIVDFSDKSLSSNLFPFYYSTLPTILGNLLSRDRPASTVCSTVVLLH